MRSPDYLLTPRRGLRAEAAFVWVARAAMVLPLLLLAWLLFDVLRDGAGRLSLDFLSAGPSRHADRAGICPALAGSLWLMALTALFALPIGIATAIYLEEYARTSRFAHVVELAIANLAGVPSIVYGILGLGVFVRWLGLGASVLSGAATLALLVLPVVIVTSREALRTVRDALREAAWGLGATRWQTVRRVVLPAALPGMLTGAILAISRAIGETAPLLLVGAVAFISFAPTGPRSPYTALPMQIYRWTSMPQHAFLQNAAAGIVVLLLTLFTLNFTAIVLRNRFARRA